MAGLFITFEGIEGVGKTTQIARTEVLLRQRQGVCQTREPGGTALGEQIRELLLSTGVEPMDEATELLLMFAARAEHLARVIRPALGRGELVLCDRFTDATYAYQGGGRGLDVARIDDLVGIVHPDLRPDCTILLDAPVDLALGRAGRRGEGDRFERERRDFFERVRDAYLARAEAEPERFVVIDASVDEDAVFAAIARALDEVLT